MDLKTILGAAYTDEIAQAIKDAIGKEFRAADDFNAKIAAMKDLTAQIAERDKQIAELGKTAKGHEELTAKIAELTEANEKTAADYKARLKTERETRLLNQELDRFNPISRDALKAVLDLKTVKYHDTDDKCEGVAEQVEKLKADATLKALFKPATEQSLANPYFSIGAPKPIPTAQTSNQRESIGNVLSELIK